MNYETKRDVFGQLLNAYQNLSMKDIQIPDENYRENITIPWNIVYDAALPDDLPVIPKAVGEYIRKAKEPGKLRLLDVFWRLGDNISAVGVNRLYDWQRWMSHNQVAVALAWVLGVWIVEETGEIVKLEAEE